MTTRQVLRQIGREWLVTLLACALLIAPFGCEFQQQLVDWTPPGSNGGNGGNGFDKDSAGLFLNEDTTDDLIVAGRNDGGDAFFVFGTRQATGAVGQVESVLIRTADDHEAAIFLNARSWPTFIQGLDGSYVQITYDDSQWPRRLTVSAEVYDASADTTETVEAVTVDLQTAIDDVVASLESLTGVDVRLPTLPANGTAKLGDRALGPLLSALLVIPMIAVAHVMVLIMGQVMAAVFEAVAIAMQAAVIAAFAPIWLFSGLLGEVVIEVESLPLLEVFVELPAAPTIDVQFD